MSLRLNLNLNSVTTLFRRAGGLYAGASLNLDFINNPVVDPRVTFTRASSATRTNSDGLVELVSSNTPRFDYSPAGVPKGLLIEEQRTNLLLYSEQFDNAAWGKNAGATVSANISQAPDGVLSADALTVSATKQIFQPIVLQPAGTYCVSTFVKATGAPQFYLQINVAGVVNAVGLDVNFVAKTVSVRFGTPVAYGVIDCGDGWLRPWISLTSNATATVTPYFVSAKANKILRCFFLADSKKDLLRILADSKKTYTDTVCQIKGPPP